MDLKDLRRLLEALAETGVSEFTLETGDYKLTLKRGVIAQQEAASAQSAPAQSAPPPATLAGALAAGTEPEKPASSSLVEVTAPIVGTFYASPTPDAPLYVKLGDRVEEGQVLCIIEAMKLMNEIEAETSGILKEILVRNEEPVEYGQVLFRIEPA